MYHQAGRHQLLALAVLTQCSFATEFPSCPAHWCLRKINSGDDVSSYQCEVYPDTGHQCAIETAPCLCDGWVSYGNYKKMTDEIEVTGSTECTNDNLGHPVNGEKACWCRPKTQRFNSHQTETGHAPAAAPSGYKVPDCLYVNGTFLVADAVKPMVHEMAIRMGVQGAFLLYHETQNGVFTTVAAMDIDEYKFVANVPAFGNMAGLVAKIDKVRGDKEAGKPLKDALSKALLANAEALKEAAMLGQFIDFEIKALPDPPATTVKPEETADVALARSAMSVGGSVLGAVALNFLMQ